MMRRKRSANNVATAIVAIFYSCMCVERGCGVWTEVPCEASKATVDLKKLHAGCQIQWSFG